MPIRSMKDVATRMAEVHQVPRRSVLASVSLVLAVLLAGAALMVTAGVRWDVFHFRTGFALLRVCVYGGVVSGGLALTALWITLPFRSNTRGFTLSVMACLISGLIVGIPLSHWMKFNETPPIHDVSTDTRDLPRFQVIRHFRSSAANPLVTEDLERTALQQQFYPDLEPLTLGGLSKSECVLRSLQAARNLEWTIRSANWADGRIEATERTFWFGFKDDVVVRITEGEGGCTLDMRSVSRQGKSDGGKNARRIKRFFEEVRKLK